MSAEINGHISDSSVPSPLPGHPRPPSVPLLATSYPLSCLVLSCLSCPVVSASAGRLSGGLLRGCLSVVLWLIRRRGATGSRGAAEAAVMVMERRRRHAAAHQLRLMYGGAR